MNQREQVIKALELFRRTGDHVSTAKLLLKFPEAGTYLLSHGSSVYADAVLSAHNLVPLLVGASAGFDLSRPLIERADGGPGENPGENVLDILLTRKPTQRSDSQNDITRTMALTLLGAAPTLAERAGGSTLIQAIVIDNSKTAAKQGDDLFYHLSPSVNNLEGKDLYRVFNALIETQYFARPGAENIDFAILAIEKISNETLSKVCAAFQEFDAQVPMISRAIAFRREGLVTALLDRPLFAQQAASVDYISLAREARWSNEGIAKLEHHIIGNLVLDHPAVKSEDESGPDDDASIAEPVRGINRRSMF